MLCLLLTLLFSRTVIMIVIMIVIMVVSTGGSTGGSTSSYTTSTSSASCCLRLLFLLLLLLFMLLLLLLTRAVACSAKCQVVFVVLAEPAGAVCRAPACLVGGGLCGLCGLPDVTWAKQSQRQHSQNVLTSAICDQAYTTSVQEGGRDDLVDWACFGTNRQVAESGDSV